MVNAPLHEQVKRNKKELWLEQEKKTVSSTAFYFMHSDFAVKRRLATMSNQHSREVFSGRVEGLPVLHARRFPFSPARNVIYQTIATSHMDSDKIKKGNNFAAFKSKSRTLQHSANQQLELRSFLSSDTSHVCS